MSNTQLQDAWSMCVPNGAENDNAKTIADSSKLEVGPNLKEHDYIGLSNSTGLRLPQPSAPPGLARAHVQQANNEEDECGDTELRLGIGPYDGAVNSDLPPKCNPLSIQQYDHSLLQQHNEHKELGDGPSSQFQISPISDCPQRGASFVELHQSFWPWGPGVAPGRFMIPVPKVSTVPSKRTFMEIAGEASRFSMLSSSSDMEGSTTAPPLPASPQGLGGGGFYSWSPSPSTSAGTSWQHLNFEQEGKSFGAFSQIGCPLRPLPPPAHPSLFKPSLLPPPPSSSEKEIPIKSESGKDDARRNKAPVVGWPPVRSFRKNTLQSGMVHIPNKTDGTARDIVQKKEDGMNSPDGGLGAGESVAEQSNGIAKDALFVKAKLDGIRICRKVDLKSYDSYDTLKSALQEMFQGFICNENAKLDLLHGKHYVLTHEDKDGDWMLVGDVPWHMFASTVKSFRIMKASDAIGLGEKVFAKLERQDMNGKA